MIFKKLFQNFRLVDLSKFHSIPKTLGIYITLNHRYSGVTLGEGLEKGGKRQVLKRCGRMRPAAFGLMTTIGKTPDGSSRYNKMKEWHKRSTSAAFRKKYNLKIVDEIRRICFRMHLPKNAEAMAFKIYRKARINKITNGRRCEWIAAACVYASCRVSGFPRSIEEFAKVAQLQPKSIGRTYLVMKRTLGLPDADSAGPLIQIHRIALIAGLSPEIEKLAVKMLEKQLYGGKPTTLAATALYVASAAKGGKCTQSKLAKAAGINENSLRNCYQNFNSRLRS